MMRPEDRLQSRVRMYLDAALPAPGYWSSVEHAKKQSLRQGQMQKAKGVKRGLPDVMIWYRGVFVGVELKAGKNTTSDMQDLVGAALVANGFRYHVVRRVVDLDRLLRECGLPIQRSMLTAAEHHDACLLADAPVPKKRPSARRIVAKPTQAALAFAARYQRP